MSDEEQKLRVRHVGRDGRRRYDPGSKARLVAACLEPGVSISGLALTHGINANLLRKWVKEARESGPLAVLHDRRLSRSWQQTAACLSGPARWICRSRVMKNNEHHWRRRFIRQVYPKSARCCQTA